jgi:uncharacterized protein YycO
MTFSVGFSRPKKRNVLSWLIMKVMGTNYSHTYLVFDVPATGQQVVMQANRRGVHCLEYSTFKKDNIIVDEINILNSNRNDALKFCIKHLGKSYSILTLFTIMFKIKFSDNKRRFICSELVARALKLDIPNLDTITPKEIRKILEERYANL